MRRNFAQVLARAEVSLKQEYITLVELLYEPCRPLGVSGRLYDVARSCFVHFPFRGTCISLDDFDDRFGFEFYEDPAGVDLDDLLDLCEYVYNIAKASLNTEGCTVYGWIDICLFALDHVNKVVEKVGHVATRQGEFTVFVERDSAAIAVAESEGVPERLSYRVLEYGHRSLKGDVESKKTILRELGDALEPRRGELKVVDARLESAVFSGLNNANIRHNNFDESDRARFRPHIAALEAGDLEGLYDSLYRLLLLAHLALDCQGDIGRVKELCSS